MFFFFLFLAVLVLVLPVVVLLGLVLVLVVVAAVVVMVGGALPFNAQDRHSTSAFLSGAKCAETLSGDGLRDLSSWTTF